MKLIKPSEISSKVMTLIEESDKFVVLVSPYVKIQKWYKLVKKLDALQTRKIPFQFIIRDDRGNQNSFNELDALKYSYKAIPDLHTKLYINENYAIVSSMNLLLSSEINSLEIGYRTETQEEYKELIDYCERYLNVDFSPKKSKQAQLQDSKIPKGVDWRDYILNILSQMTNGYLNSSMEDKAFIINYKNNRYTCFVANVGGKNYLRINAILSGAEYEVLSQRNGFDFSNPKLRPEIYNKRPGEYDMLWATLDHPLMTSNLEYTYRNDYDTITEGILDFVSRVAEFKENYNNW